MSHPQYGPPPTPGSAGWPGQGPNPYGGPAPYPGPPAPPGFPPATSGGTAPAYIAAALFLACSILSYVVAGISWDGSTDNLNALAAVIGMVFAEDITGNVDFGIATTMTVASTVLCGSLAMLARLEVLRWIMGGLGGIIALYYGYAFVFLLAHHAAAQVPIVLVALLLWLAATVFTLLPATRAAMRRPRRAPVAPLPGGYPGWS